MTQPTLIAFDADDTLWQNETLYHNAQETFVGLLTHYHPEEWIRERLFQTEMRNLDHFGYGIKAFALSMIETVVELTEGRVKGEDIRTLIDVAKAMIDADIELLPGVRDVVENLSQHTPLAIITKGDLLDQQRKVERSKIGHYFTHIEVVADKNLATYQALMSKMGVAPVQFLMIGNSLKSDILPILELGGQAVYVPHGLTWEHEHAPTPAANTPGFFQIETISQLPGILKAL